MGNDRRIAWVPFGTSSAQRTVLKNNGCDVVHLPPASWRECVLAYGGIGQLRSIPHGTSVCSGTSKTVPLHVRRAKRGTTQSVALVCSDAELCGSACIDATSLQEAHSAVDTRCESASSDGVDRTEITRRRSLATRCDSPGNTVCIPRRTSRLVGVAHSVSCASGYNARDGCQRGLFRRTTDCAERRCSSRRPEKTRGERAFHAC